MNKMKKYVAFMCCTILAACTESLDLSSIHDKSALNNQNAQALGIDVGPVTSFQWTKLSTPRPEFSSSVQFPRPYVIGEKVFVKAGDQAKYLFKLSDTKKKWDYISSGPVEDAFENCTNYDNRENYMFSYGSKFYYYFFGTFKSMDVNTGTQEELTPFPGLWRRGKMSFVFGTKGYVMGGERLINNEYQNVNDLWEYNFATDQWTYKGGVPGGNRSEGVAIVVNEKLYVGMGSRMNNGDVEYKYDWLQIDLFGPGPHQVLATYPGPPFLNREGQKLFTANNKIFVCDDDYPVGNELFGYNPATNEWSEQDSPVKDNNPNSHFFFSLGSAGYMIKNDLKELWRYSRTSLEPTNP